MGVKGLTKWIETYAPSALQQISFSSLKDKNLVLAIDASILMYGSELAISANGYEMRNRDGHITSHLYVIFYRTLKLILNGIIPVYVFDGKHDRLKNVAMKERQHKKKQIEKEIKIAKITGSLNVKQIKKKQLQTFTINQHMYNSLIKMLDLMGISYIEAHGEADSLLAYMNIYGYVDGVISEDTDVAIFGAKVMYKNFFRGMKKPSKNLISCIKYEAILNELNWSREKLASLAILLGCDYAPHILGMGPVMATKLLLSGEKINSIGERFIKKGTVYDLAQNLYLNEGHSVQDNMIEQLGKIRNIKNNKIKADALLLSNFLIYEQQMSRDRITKAINQYIKFINSN